MHIINTAEPDVAFPFAGSSTRPKFRTLAKKPADKLSDMLTCCSSFSSQSRSWQYRLGPDTPRHRTRMTRTRFGLKRPVPEPSQESSDRRLNRIRVRTWICTLEGTWTGHLLFLERNQSAEKQKWERPKWDEVENRKGYLGKLRKSEKWERKQNNWNLSWLWAWANLAVEGAKEIRVLQAPVTGAADVAGASAIPCLWPLV